MHIYIAVQASLLARTFFSLAVQWFAVSLKRPLPILWLLLLSVSGNSDQPRCPCLNNHKAFVLVCPANFVHQVAPVKTTFLLKTEPSTLCVCVVHSLYPPRVDKVCSLLPAAVTPLWHRYADTHASDHFQFSSAIAGSLAFLSMSLRKCHAVSCSSCIMGHSILQCIGVPIFFFWQLCQCLLFSVWGIKK